VIPMTANAVAKMEVSLMILPPFVSPMR
jgi:hypothetical protein